MADIIICTIQKPQANQKPPVLIESEVYCAECHSIHELEKCPECDSWIDVWYDPMSFLTNKACGSECGWSYSEREGCMSWFINDMFTSREHYESSDEYPLHCEVHNCHAWECFAG